MLSHSPLIIWRRALRSYAPRGYTDQPTIYGERRELQRRTVSTELLHRHPNVWNWRNAVTERTARCPLIGRSVVDFCAASRTLATTAFQLTTNTQMLRRKCVECEKVSRLEIGPSPIGRER